MQITQNGRPPQNPARPAEILAAKPSVKVATKADPINPEILSIAIRNITRSSSKSGPCLVHVASHLI